MTAIVTAEQLVGGLAARIENGVDANYEGDNKRLKDAMVARNFFTAGAGGSGTPSPTSGVTSFNGRTGAVTLGSSDIKTINGQSLLGSGNITISAGTTPTLDAVVKAGNTTSTSATFNGGAILSGLTVGGTVLQPSWRATIRGGSSDDTALLCYSLSATSGGRILALACSYTSVALAAFFYGNPGAVPTPPNVGSITTNGVSVSYNTTSDYRLKDNVVDLDNALVRVNQLKPRRFSWRANPSIITEGFIAHEVAEIIPEVITGEKDAVDAKGEIVPQNIDHSKLIPILTAAIKELSSELSILRDRIDKLEQNVTT
jgi:hypothetical protein